jgi:hypothetical protein
MDRSFPHPSHLRSARVSLAISELLYASIGPALEVLFVIGSGRGPGEFSLVTNLCNLNIFPDDLYEATQLAISRTSVIENKHGVIFLRAKMLNLCFPA